MSKLRVNNFSISIDGYGAGPSQSLEDPLGGGGEALHEWIVATKTFQQMSGNKGGTTGEDDAFAARGFSNIGAWILGRNMFGPIRGSWPDDSWKGWWGDTPPYHTPVFVLTNHLRESIAMDGGTTFHFITDGIHAALERARQAANGQDVRLGGVWLPSASISELDSSTKSISLSARFSWAPANTFSPTSICSRWATTALSTLPLPERCTAF